MPGWIDGWMDGWMDGWVDGWMDGWLDGWMDGEKSCFIPRASAKIHRAPAYNVYPFSDDGGLAGLSARRDSRRLPFFGALNYRPELRNSSLERVYAGGLNTAAYDPGELDAERAVRGREKICDRLFDVALNRKRHLSLSHPNPSCRAAA